MAWKLNLLVWISFMAVDAHNCKNAYGFIRGIPYPYDYVNSAPMTPPSSPPHHNMNTRSSDNTPHSEEQARIIGPISSKPYISNRRGESNPIVNDRVIFPGPTSRRTADPVIPDECKAAGYCEEVLNYPRELAEQLIANISPNEYQLEELEDIPNIMHRFGGADDNRDDSIDLCESETKLISPSVAQDATGSWQYVLNSEEKPVQTFRAEVCTKLNGACSNIIIFQKDYSGSCVQKFTYRKMITIDNGKTVEKKLKLPSCCTCVGKRETKVSKRMS